MKKFLLVAALLGGVSFSSMAAEKLSGGEDRSADQKPLLDQSKAAAKAPVKADMTCINDMCGHDAGCLIYESADELYEWVSLLRWEYC